MNSNKELDLLKKENEELKDKIRKLQIIEDLFYWDKKMKPTIVENIVMILD